jgi:hypothetical protein
MSAMRIWF